MKYIFTLFALFIVASCAASVSTQARPRSYYANTPTAEAQNLFSEAAALDDESIRKILDFQLHLPSLMRVTVLDLSDIYGGRKQFTVNERVMTGLFGTLIKSSRVYDASFFPALLLPAKANLENLRFAAARYQADLLLMYSTQCRDFSDYNVFDANVTKTYCTVEAVAMDIRSGIVPFSSTVSFEIEKKEDKKKTVNFHETQMRAQLEATSRGLEQVGKDLRSFIEKTPASATRSSVEGVESP